jgi:hypothetical protein
VEFLLGESLGHRERVKNCTGLSAAATGIFQRSRNYFFKETATPAVQERGAVDRAFPGRAPQGAQVVVPGF